MSRFLQIHLLTPYHPSNLNRDDLGRPKTAIMGGAQRLRVSSQSLKRAWRTSELFQEALAGRLGARTKEQGEKVMKALLEKGVPEKKAAKWAEAVAGVFGKNKKDNPLHIEQLAHFGPEEKAAIAALVDKLAESGEPPSEEDLALLRRPESAVDIAMFGRMLASRPEYNVEAAVQVAHAITVNQAVVEDDFFTAVDDLNEGLEDVGAGHMGETEFGAGVFYLYLCVDCALLLKNLGNDASLAARARAALLEAAAKVSPTGKQNSFASRAYAQYILLERGDQQPRSLAVAFLEPVKGADHLSLAVGKLSDAKDKMDKAYGPLAEARAAMDVLGGEGSLAELLAFVGEC